MKTLTTYINEKLILNKDTFKNNYKYFPKTKIELFEILQDIIINSDWQSDNVIDLNNINTYEITDMSELFASLDIKNIDISRWDVSNVENMEKMFYKCMCLKTTGDLSNWNVSKVKNTDLMFSRCVVLDNIGDISNWDISNIKDTHGMFEHCRRLSQIGNLFKWKNKSNPDAVYDNMFIGSPNLIFLDRWWEK